MEECIIETMRMEEFIDWKERWYLRIIEIGENINKRILMFVYLNVS
jgi:hypothetical protein